MVYAVSDRVIRSAPTRGVRVAARRRVTPSITLHWPRVIALLVNVLVWVAIIAVAAHAFQR